MKIKGHYYLKPTGGIFISPECDVINYKEYDINYSRYLANAMTFLDTIRPINELLGEIEKLRNGEIEVFEYGTEIFFYDLYKDRVEFEPDFYEDWDNWTCLMEEFEKALIGWREFMKMPKSEESYIEIEINED